MLSERFSRRGFCRRGRRSLDLDSLYAAGPTDQITTRESTAKMASRIAPRDHATRIYPETAWQEPLLNGLARSGV